MRTLQGVFFLGGGRGRGLFFEVVFFVCLFAVLSLFVCPFFQYSLVKGIQECFMLLTTAHSGLILSLVQKTCYT